jgi:uncharacterized protein (TIGR02594 family)
MTKLEIPKQYRWLYYEGGPKILVEFLKLYGIQEFEGEKNNPIILEWSREIRDYVGIEYNSDSLAWCGLLCGVVVLRAGYIPPFLCIRALEWLKFGRAVKQAMLGDILVFNRKGGGHVGIYVGEDKHCFHVLGGNQSDAVSIVRIDKTRLQGARRPIWKVGQPDNVRPVFMDITGKISHNEL